MAAPRLTIDSTACFIIDVQQNILPDMHDHERLVDRCAFVATVAGVLGLPTVLTEQVTRVFGRTADAVSLALPGDTARFEKSQFSGCVSPVLDWLGAQSRQNVVVAGIEAHICVMQTTLDLLDRGFQVFLVTDAISSGEADQTPHALRRMEQAGAILTGCVSMAYELLRDAKHPQFKACLEPVKRLRSGAAGPERPGC